MGVMKYIPRRGDIVWINFDPTLGHEQKGRRPALVISSEKYNKLRGCAILCPITSKIKGYIFEVVLDGKGIKGSVLTDQLRTMDFNERNVQFIEKAPQEIQDTVGDRIKALLFD